MSTRVAPAERRASGIRIAEVMARLDESGRDQFLRTHRRLVNPLVAQRLLDQSRQHLRVDFHRSLVLAQGAAWIADRLNDGQLRAQSLRAMANAHCLSGRNRTAVDLHTQAVAVFEASGNEPELARTLSAAVQPLILLGRYDRALDSAARARQLFTKHGDEVRLARLEIHVGNVLHRQDRFAEALACYERGHTTLARLGDGEGIISALHNKGVTLTALNDFHQALAAYRAARALCVERGMPLAVTQADYNIASLYYLRGEYNRAIEMLRATADAAKQSGDAYHAALALLDLSEIYLELNLNADAREMAEQAHDRFTELGMGYEAAKALVNTAIGHGREGRAFLAIDLLAEARNRLVREKNHVWPALVDVYRAVLLSNEGRLFEARRLCRAALAVFNASPLRSKAALCRLLLARITLRLGEPRVAQRHAQDALAHLDAGGSPLLTYHARVLLGHAAAQLGDRAGAYASYRMALEALETLRSRLRGEELKIAFVNNKMEVYERLIELCLEGAGGDTHVKRVEEALGYVEQAKSRTLLDLMFQPVHAFARVEAGESALAQSIRELREELNWYYHLIELEDLRPRERSPERLQRFRREIGTREKEMARVLQELTVSDAQQSELHIPCVSSIDAIRDALPPDGVLLEYFQVDDRILVCLLDRRGIDMAPISVTSRIADHVRMLRFQLSKFRLGADYLGTFRDPLLQATRAHLQELFTELLAPVWSRVRDRHLVIVPHGPLHYVPFHALYDGQQYVIEVSPVSYAPSASIYARCHAQPPVSGGAPLVLGVADTQAPFIEQEARAVAGALPAARLFIGAEATEHVLRTLGAHSPIVHIASHGYFRPDSPMFSSIRLGDRYLNVYDLYRLRLRAQLVTLSGCATGATALAAGDELLGIARGLFAAGAQTLLLSLWPVHDESTATFMRVLYSQVSRGVPAASAVRAAMLDLRHEYPHPYYWAPFTVMGKCWHA